MTVQIDKPYFDPCNPTKWSNNLSAVAVFDYFVGPGLTGPRFYSITLLINHAFLSIAEI